MSSQDSHHALHIRLARKSDWAEIVALIQEENWFILSTSMLDVVLQEMSTKFYVLEDTSSGAPGLLAAVTSITKARNGEMMLGNVATRKELRGRGHGTSLVRHVIEQHKDSIVCWVSLADEFYIKLGYHIVEQPAVLVDMEVVRERVIDYCLANPLNATTQLVSLTADRREDVVRYDTVARGYANGDLMRLLFRTASCFTLAVDGSDQGIVGYTAAMDEPGGSLYYNGLYADTDGIAAALLSHSLGFFPHRDNVRFACLQSRQFLTQFGRRSPDGKYVTVKMNRYSASRARPARIPEAKLYCFPQTDLAY